MSIMSRMQHYGSRGRVHQAGVVKRAFDWKPNKHYPDQLFEAPMENGHKLYVSPGAIPGYGYQIFDGNDREVASSPIAGQQPGDTDNRNWRHPHDTPQDAMKAAEQHYQQLFPIGTNTGGHDSGVDYSDLNSFKDYL